MASQTKEHILETALELFAQNGYLGTSMRDIAEQLNITKAALYKHYAGKQEILDSLVQRMSERDAAYARHYEMPEEDTAPSASTRPQQIAAYSKAMFRYWTEDAFAACFRRMLTLEQYRDPVMARLYQDYLAAGPMTYMATVFRELCGSEEKAQCLALAFYGSMHLFYSVYDGASEKEPVFALLSEYIDHFMAPFVSPIGQTDRRPGKKGIPERDRTP